MLVVVFGALFAGADTASAGLLADRPLEQDARPCWNLGREGQPLRTR
ncbi:MAG TPA: hypothetical protein VFY14_05995 [Streptomyces sp.]|nr:hypothetical protein [Streptomyces sp.]